MSVRKHLSVGLDGQTFCCPKIGDIRIPDKSFPGIVYMSIVSCMGSSFNLQQGMEPLWRTREKVSEAAFRFR
jgi:hypothetical protein